jgi:cobalt-zinc-cadmium efflux system outer membrane protein
MPRSMNSSPKRTAGWRSTLIMVIAGLSLGGCAAYRPAPLQADARSVLAPPDLAGLVASASTFRHPRLKPAAIDLSKPLTPSALGIIAVLSNPDLKAARAKANVADAQVFAAGLLPDPSLTLGFDHLLSGPDSVDPMIGQIAFDLNALRTRRATLAGQRAAREQVRLDLAWQEWQTAGQARLLASRIAGLEQVSAISVQSRTAADLMLARVLQAAARGDVKADEVEIRRIAAADAADKARQAERDLDAARLDLNKLLGLQPQAQLPITAPSSRLDILDAEALFERARSERLDLVALERGYQSQEAGVRKAILDQFPNLQLTISRARDATNNQTIGPSINFTLPLWNRNRGGIRVAEATRAQLQSEYAARLFTTRADIATLVAGIEVARRQRREIAAQVAPLEQIVQATESAAGHGDVSQATAQAARQSLNDKKLTLATLDQALAEQGATLEIAVGAPLEDILP